MAIHEMRVSINICSLPQQQLDDFEIVIQDSHPNICSIPSRVEVGVRSMIKEKFADLFRTFTYTL